MGGPQRLGCSLSESIVLKERIPSWRRLPICGAAGCQPAIRPIANRHCGQPSCRGRRVSECPGARILMPLTQTGTASRNHFPGFDRWVRIRCFLPNHLPEDRKSTPPPRPNISVSECNLLLHLQQKVVLRIVPPLGDLELRDFLPTRRFDPCNPAIRNRSALRAKGSPPVFSDATASEPANCRELWISRPQHLLRVPGILKNLIRTQAPLRYPPHPPALPQTHATFCCRCNKRLHSDTNRG